MTQILPSIIEVAATERWIQKIDGDGGCCTEMVRERGQT